MRRDLIHDHYGRLYELPHHLSRRHQVHVIATDYRPGLTWKARRYSGDEDSQPVFYSIKVNYLILPTIASYLYLLNREIRRYPPDIIIGCSDSLHIIVAWLLGKFYGIRVIHDLYDNFDIFGLTRIPGIRLLYHRAIAVADAVTCVSDKLSAYIRTNYRKGKRVYTIESVINTSDFYPVDSREARRGIGLDPDYLYIGTAGALFANRGISTIYEAFLEIVKKRHDVRLLLAGVADPDCPIPQHENIIHLGDIDYSRMNTFYNSLDVALNYMRDDDFGRYSFPQKAFEMLACRRPVLSARVGDFEHLLPEKFLYTPGDSVDLENKILALLDSPCHPDIDILDWEGQSLKFDAVLSSIN